MSHTPARNPLFSHLSSTYPADTAHNTWDKTAAFILGIETQEVERCDLAGI